MICSEGIQRNKNNVGSILGILCVKHAAAPCRCRKGNGNQNGWYFRNWKSHTFPIVLCKGVIIHVTSRFFSVIQIEGVIPLQMVDNMDNAVVNAKDVWTNQVPQFWVKISSRILELNIYSLFCKIVFTYFLKSKCLSKSVAKRFVNSSADLFVKCIPS